jgi:Rrf2 family protein
MNSLLRVSSKNHLGLIVMASLAKAAPEGRFVTLQEIADRMSLSQGYLEEIAAALKHAGLMEGKKGTGGGYRLSKPADRISVEEILVALEGPLAMVDCQATGKACPVESACSTKQLWYFLQQDVLATLKATTLQQVIDQTP